MGRITEFFSNIFSGTVTSGIDAIGKTADRFIHTKEEKAEFELELKRFEMEMEKLRMKGEEMYMLDRQSAREMYMKDSSLQKIFAIVFLVGYLGITTAMLFLVFGWLGLTAKLEPFEASIISMIFTAMSTKVNTIVDFLFGGSKKENNIENKIATEFKDNI